MFDIDFPALGRPYSLSSSLRRVLQSLQFSKYRLFLLGLVFPRLTELDPPFRKRSLNNIHSPRKEHNPVLPRRRSRRDGIRNSELHILPHKQFPQILSRRKRKGLNSINIVTESHQGTQKRQRDREREDVPRRHHVSCVGQRHMLMTGDVH